MHQLFLLALNGFINSTFIIAANIHIKVMYPSSLTIIIIVTTFIMPLISPRNACCLKFRVALRFNRLNGNFLNSNFELKLNTYWSYVICLFFKSFRRNWINIQRSAFWHHLPPSPSSFRIFGYFHKISRYHHKKNVFTKISDFFK